MRVRIICVLILSVAFAVFLTAVMTFGESFYVDYYYGGLGSTDPIFIAASAILGLVTAGGLWLADIQKRRLPLPILPLAIVLAMGVGYGSTALAFQYASSRYDILTDDCYYDNALAYRRASGVFISWGGKTAFHPLQKVRSMNPLPAAVPKSTEA